MAPIFGDAKGSVLIDSLQNGHTINGEYYTNFLGQLQKAIKTKYPGKLKKGICLYEENVPVYFGFNGCSVQFVALKWLISFPIILM